MRAAHIIFIIRSSCDGADVHKSYSQAEILTLTLHIFHFCVWLFFHSEALVSQFGAPNTYQHPKIKLALKMFSAGNHWRSLKAMSGIDLFISKHGVNALNWDHFTIDQKMYFLAVQAAMQYQFYSDACATFYNTKLQTWNTCWYDVVHHSIFSLQ